MADNHSGQLVPRTKIRFREIGAGSISKVFEHPGTIYAYKLPVSEHRSERLWNNYIMHKRIEASFQSLPYQGGQIEIPRCFWYATPSTNAFWNENLESFPETPNFQRRSRHVLCMERIPPLPRQIRDGLIDEYGPRQARTMMKEDDANGDCLVLPCLGKVHYTTTGQFFSLRNYKLHANQIQDHNLPGLDYTTSMARAIATLHWHTRVDGRGIEFALGGAPSKEQMIRTEFPLDRLASIEPHTSTYEEMTHPSQRLTALWMLDFDECQDISMDKHGVDRAVRAFLETNLFCPLPQTGDDYINTLWTAFNRAYIEHSDAILARHINRPELIHLPRQFIAKICIQAKARAESGQQIHRYVRSSLRS